MKYTICSNMDGHRDYYTKSKTNIILCYVWNQKKSDTDELKYRNTNRPTHIENKLTVPKGEKER